MFEMFGKKKTVENIENVDENKEDELREKKDTALLYLSKAIEDCMAALDGKDEKLDREIAALKNSAKDSFTGTDDISGALDDIQNEYEKIIPHAEKFEQVKTEIASKVRESQGKAVSLNEASDEIRVCFEDVVRGIEEYTRQQQNINQALIRTVKDCMADMKNIASRADVLALSATIEASKAGEKALGLAHVTNDIRSVSGDIRDVYDKLDKNTQTAQADSKAISEGIASSKAAIVKNTDGIRQAQKSLDDIMGVADGLDDACDKIRECTDNVSKKLEVLGEKIERLSDNYKELEKRISLFESPLGDYKDILSNAGNLISQIEPVVNYEEKEEELHEI